MLQDIKYDTILVYDIRLQAFTKYEISDLVSNSPAVVGVVDTGGSTSVARSEYVTDLGSVVIDDGEDLTTTISTEGGVDTTYKFVTMLSDGTDVNWTFSAMNNTSFSDWQTADEQGLGASYDSYIETGDNIGDDPSKKKSIPYVVTYLGLTETGFVGNSTDGYRFENPGGGYLLGKFDWHNSAAGNKWTSQSNIYRLPRNWVVNPTTLDYDSGAVLVVNKTRLRGKGRAFRIRIQSEDYKDMVVHGWTLKATQVTNI